MMCLHMNRKAAHVACNINSFIDTEGLFKDTSSQEHYKCGIMLETVQDGFVLVTTDQ